MQPIAVACKAGDVSRRYFLGLIRPFNPMVQGSSPWRPTIDFAGLCCFSDSANSGVGSRLLTRFPVLGRGRRA